MKSYKLEKVLEELGRRGIGFKDQTSRPEIEVKCIFGSCDRDSRKGEYHMYINRENGTFFCHKCNAKGNLMHLYKRLELMPDSDRKYVTRDYTHYSAQLTTESVDYLQNRGLKIDSIRGFHLGYGEFYNQMYITIPIFDQQGAFLFYKLRRFPDSQAGPKYLFHPSRSKQSSVFGLDTLIENAKDVIVCEGEFDCIMLKQLELNAITSTSGAGTFKDEWLSVFNQFVSIYLFFDNDSAGIEGAERLMNRISSMYPDKTVRIIPFPPGRTEKDISELVANGFDIKTYILEKQKEYEATCIGEDFEEMAIERLQDILGLTIKRDNKAKAITFLSMLSAFTDDSSVNVMFNAPSSSGKSYIPTEIAKYFPQENVLILGYCSPMAFFHDNSIRQEGTEQRILNLEHKIIILVDSPHTELLSKLRPILSHDIKVMRVKITDKQQGSNKTKDILVRGYPSMIFCTANLDFDEQEQTRFFVLSPEISNEKIQESMRYSVVKEGAPELIDSISENENAQKLVRRIIAIKKSGIIRVIYDPDELKGVILGQFSQNRLQAKDQRELKRIIYLTKAFALLNYFHRERIDGKTIKATKQDAITIIGLLKEQLEIQQLGISPYVYDIYRNVLCSLVEQNLALNKEGLSLRVIATRFLEYFHRPMHSKSFKYSVAYALENAGLVDIVPDPGDRRTVRYVVKKVNTRGGGSGSQIGKDVVE